MFTFLGNLSENFYFVSGTINKPDCGEKRGFADQWQAEMYLDENREHAEAAVQHDGLSRVMQVIERTTGNVMYVEFILGEKPTALPLWIGDVDVLVDVGAIDGEPAAMSGVVDDCDREELDIDQLVKLDQLFPEYITAYYMALQHGRGVFFRETSLTLSSNKKEKRA